MDKMKILRLLLITAIVVTAISTPSFAVEYFLRAERIIKTVPDSNGVAIPMWGFAADSAFDANDGQVTVPGPLLTVPVGDSTLTIHLDNNLTVPISIVINGQSAVLTPVRNPDGRIRSFTHETDPNNAAPVDYVWTNVRPGSYIYQSGTHPAVQVQMGLYGGVVKDYASNQAYRNIIYENSVPLFFSEIDLELHNAVDSNDYGPGKAMTSTIDYEPDYFLINGQAFVPGQASLPAGTYGGGTLLRMFNAGLKTRSPLLQGSHMKLVAEDGQQYRYTKDQYVVSLLAGKTMDAMVTFPSAGTYPLYDRALGLTNAQALGGGMLVHLETGAGNFWPVINSVTATPASIFDTQTSQLLVNANDSDGPSPLSYNWEVPLGSGSLNDPTIANPVFTPSFIAGMETYTLTVTVSDGLHMAIGDVDVTVTGYVAPVEVIVDNLDAETSSIGVWSPSGASGFWATNSVWANDAGDSFTFNSNLAPGTAYAVYEWHTVLANRYTEVPHQIHNGALLLDMVTVNQQINGGQWNLLGVYTFNSPASVTVLATPGFSTCADAVRFLPLGALQSLTITGGTTVDEGTTQTYIAIADFDSGISLPVMPQLWSVDVPQASISPTGILTAGLVDADTPVVVSAEYTLNGTTVASTHDITILNSGGGTPVEVIVDNLDVGTSSVGVWSTSSAPGFWATNSVWANDTGDSFIFTANLVPGATYQVYEWHTEWPSRYTAVPHEIHTGATLLGTVTVNQQINGGQWNLLGTYTFTEATASVTIAATPGYSSCADAVRFVPVTTPVEIVVDNLDAAASSVGVWLPSGASGFWATDSVWANDLGDSFTFNANLVPGTNYEVYEWHTQWPSRYTAVLHEIRTGATLLATIPVGQQLNGGQWNLLGTFGFAETAASVTILATPGYSTNADAVRFVPVP